MRRAMLIDGFPQVVGGRAPLRDVFIDEALAGGVPVMTAQILFGLLPPRLASTMCFLDLLSSRWLYEFGEPFAIGQQHLYGPHVWHPVAHLLAVIACAVRRLRPAQVLAYAAKLDNATAGKHEASLVEFLPVLRLPSDFAVDFEFKTGAGQRDVDWRLRRAGERSLLVDVKRRTVDMTALGTRIIAGERREPGVSPRPNHDTRMLFRSVEKKFLPSDPDVQVQGVWIATALQQDEVQLRAAFDALDSARVHFAVLGSWGPDITVLARRDSDGEMLRAVFDRPRRGTLAFVRRGTE
jgi:hypothetical protein